MKNVSAAAIIRKPTVWISLGLLLAVAVIWTITAIRASQPPTLEQRTYAVASQLQCPVCHGESVADAPSALAQEMRSLIAEQLSEGMSEQQVITYFHDRYGDQILELPPTTGFSLVIWLGPLLALFFGLSILVSAVREFHQQKLAPASAGDSTPVSPLGGGTVLSPQDRERFHALLMAEIDEMEGYSHRGRALPRRQDRARELEEGKSV